MEPINVIYDKVAIHNYEAHEKALKAFQKSLKREQEWKELVKQGLAVCIKTPVLCGFRYHYELINKEQQ